jgi:hypothetical protein
MDRVQASLEGQRQVKASPKLTDPRPWPSETILAPLIAGVSEVSTIRLRPHEADKTNLDMGHRDIAGDITPNISTNP